MEKAFINYGLTARTYTRILKVARTIADLEGNMKITAKNIAEAIQYRFVNQCQIKDVFCNKYNQL